MRKHKITTIHKFGIFVCIFTLIVSQAGIINGKKKVKENGPKIAMIRDHEIPKRYIVKKEESQEFVVTAYDLSISSTNKSRGSSDYGITKNGSDLKNHTWKTARAISIDPKVIPLGTKVELNFKDEKYKKYDGIYICIDTGSAIKGRKIDLFMGDFHSSRVNKETINFGKTIANVTILKD